MLCLSNSFTFTFFQTMSLALNFCLCHDLIKTLKDPFYPGKRRMKFYLGCSIIVATVFTAINKSTLSDVCDNKINMGMAQPVRAFDFMRIGFVEALLSAYDDRIIKNGYYYS
jgi:hypothetical protein